MLLQLLGVGAFAAAALGSFYLNGSYTYVDKATNATRTMHGPEALRSAWAHLGTLTGEVHTLAHVTWERGKRKTWAEIWGELRDAFRDPSNEAAGILGVAISATPDEIKQAYRRLARVNHPDKAAAERREEAKQLMARINWAKEVLLGGEAGASPA